jgi:hypothetical protein
LALWGCKNDEEAAMGYRVYSGPRGSEGFRAVDKDRMLFKEFASLDEAMGWARHLGSTGHTALLIEGDDGSRLDKQEIVAALRHRETEAGADFAT